MKTFKTTNYDVNIDSLWPIFELPEKIFTLQDLSQFHSLKIESPLSPKKSIFQSPRKKSSITTDESSPKKVSRLILQSPSVGKFIYHWYQGSYNDSPGNYKWKIYKLEVRSSLPYRVETFTRRVSHQDLSFLKILVQKD
jgi:hypothetical protein